MNRKWIVLIAYSLVLFANHFIWINFMPIQNYLQQFLNRSADETMLLILVYPLFFVLVSLHSGIMIDRYGYIRVIKWSMFVMSIFAVFRAFATNFWMLLFCQSVIAIVQPYMINAISKVVSDWFGPKQNDLATGIATVGIFSGIAFAFVSTPWMVSAYGYETSMLLFAALCTFIFALFVVLVKNPNPDNVFRDSERTFVSLSDYKKLIFVKNIFYLSMISFFLLGAFNTLTAILELVLKSFQISAEQAGNVNAAVIGGGIVGALILPALADYINKRKSILLFSTLSTAVTIYLLGSNTNYETLLLLGFVAGFVSLPAIPLSYAFAQESAGSAMAGSSISLLTLVGNVGNFLFMPLVYLLRSKSVNPEWFYAILFLCAAGLCSVFFVLPLKETEEASNQNNTSQIL